MRWLGMAFLGLVGVAHAGPRTPCDTCEACTAALATPGAEVELKGPLTATAAGACVTIAGDGATFNAIGHPIQAADTAIAITGADVLLRQPDVTQAKVGVRITGARATVFGARISASDVGVAVDGAADARLDRVTVTGGQVGVAFGALAGQACAPDASLRSAGAVVQRATITGAQVGLAACEARPVVLDSEVSGNQTGLLLGDPKAAGTGPGQAGPHDACACAPTLDQVQPGTTLLFSSGCGGC
ncbi:MAG: hypothetical protein KC613_03810, partial [Myxococcales bacterium]|nr:hypothetical protein [Myxococcales bacterium]